MICFFGTVDCKFCFTMKDENKFDFKKIVSENWIEPPKRERKRK